MSDGNSTAPSLSNGQLTLIARKYGLFSGRSLVDIGSGDGQWVHSLAQRKLPIRGMEERKRTTTTASEFFAIGSPAAAVPYAAHSVDTIVFRGTSAFNAGEFQPELMIALANLGSSLKPRGSLLIPLQVDDAGRWETLLKVFPGSTRQRTLATGWMGYVTLAFLFGGMHTVDVLEFRVNRKVDSRLEWHRLAREAVLSRMNTPAAA